MVEVIPTIVSDRVDDGVYCIYLSHLDLSYMYVDWNTMHEFGCLYCRTSYQNKNMTMFDFKKMNMELFTIKISPIHIYILKYQVHTRVA